MGSNSDMLNHTFCLILYVKNLIFFKSFEKMIYKSRYHGLSFCIRIQWLLNWWYKPLRNSALVGWALIPNSLKCWTLSLCDPCKVLEWLWRILPVIDLKLKVKSLSWVSLSAYSSFIEWEIWRWNICVFNTSLKMTMNWTNKV